MPGKIAFIENLARKLSVIPGLRFLEDYCNEIRSTRTQIDQTVGDYQAYGEAVRDVGQDVRGEVTGRSESQRTEQPVS